MDAEFKTKWVKALRSGKFKQGRHRLKQKLGDGCWGLCCIAVGHKVMTGRMPNVDWETFFVALGLGLSEDQFVMLVDLNDRLEKNFAEIADYIEQNI